MDLSLLPAAHESVLCAAHARSHAIDPGGSAICADTLMAVEVPLPWPKPVFDHPWLANLVIASDPGNSVKVLAAVPTGPAGEFEVAVARRRSMSMGVERWVTDAANLADTVVSLARGHAPERAAPKPAEVKPEIWICTQGSHDRCCGSDGTRLAQEVASRRTDVIVRRVSHTGGHRFAPTALTLPDGRMWAYLDSDAVDRIVDHSGEVAEISDRCRGWWGAATGPEQMAERAVFATAGWKWDTTERHVETIDGAGVDGTSRIRVSSEDEAGHEQVHEVTVGVARHIPTIACGEPGGLPAKPGVEYRVLEHHQVEPPARR